MFHQIISGYIPLLFPVILIIVYLIDFTKEQKNNFITYTRARITLTTYILSKGLTNAIITGLNIFLMIFLSFVFAVYIEPNYIKVIDYTQTSQLSGPSSSYKVTFYQFLPYGELTYGLVYSLWVTLNAVVYSTISFLLLLILKRPYIALSVPFLFYHIFNFITGILGYPKFSPISTIFPFNIVQMPLWTVLIPFTFLFVVLVLLFFKVIRNKEEWMI